MSIRFREVHGLLQKMGSGAIDMSPPEAQKMLTDVRDRQHSLESVFRLARRIPTEMDQKLAPKAALA